MSSCFRDTIIKLIVEYLLLTLPILIYVSLEAIRHGNYAYIIASPEWSIATVFIIIQTIRIYIDEIHGNSARLITYVLILALAAITLAAGINVYIALENTQEQSMGVILTKWGLLLIATVLFVYIAGAGIYAANSKTGNLKNGE